MIGKFTGTPTPATGFSIGFERIVMLLMERGFKVPGAKEKKVYLLDKKLTNEKLLEVMKKAAEERKAGPVSYTHLDVYKRQPLRHTTCFRRW